jgi:hypothetical protein
MRVIQLPTTVVLDLNQNLPFCTVHQRHLQFKPEGISKASGKPYQAFYACPHRDESGFCKSTVKTWQVDKLPTMD